MIRILALVYLCAGYALAHLQLQDPLPIRSPLSLPVSDSRRDTSYRSPLIPDGTQYPCKGHLKETDQSLMGSQKTWPAGTTQTYTMEGTIFHGGGSCQLSLSYDMGQTWNVIQSVIGGCMFEGLTNSFVIPKEAPSGSAVFSWTWFNKFGKREMYQNCAIVTITGGGSGLNSKDNPAPFVANAGPSINACSTAESQEIVFPNPGAVVIYSGGFKGTIPQPGLNVIGTGCVHPGGADGAGTKPGKEGGAGVPDTTLVSVAPSVYVGPLVSASPPPVVPPAPTTTPPVAPVATTPLNQPSNAPAISSIAPIPSADPAHLHPQVQTTVVGGSPQASNSANAIPTSQLNQPSNTPTISISVFTPPASAKSDPPPTILPTASTTAIIAPISSGPAAAAASQLEPGVEGVYRIPGTHLSWQGSSPSSTASVVPGAARPRKECKRRRRL